MRKVHLIFYWSVPLLLLLLASCGEDAVPIANSSDVANVRVASNLGADAASTVGTLNVQGVPVNRETGESGVAKAVLEVYNTPTGEQLFFKDGQIVSEAEGEAVTFTPEEGGVALALPPGNYSFFLRAFDDREPANELALGLSENVEVGDADVQVSITLSSFLGEVSFRVPESARPNAVFDAFLEVSAPGRPDLRVPEGDYLVGYAASSPSQVLSESKLGARVAAACEDVEVTARYRSNGPRSAGGLRETSVTVPIRGEACGGANSNVGADLVPPFIAITSLEDGSTVGQTFTLSGDVNDQQSGVDRVEVYEGTVLLGEADIDTDEMRWSFGVSLEKGDYALTVVAFDNAGNTSREEVRVTVGEGDGGGEGGENETCANPVSIPDENLRETIRGALGLSDDAELTCDNLAELTELTLFTRAPRRGPDTRVMRLEGLQFARNLERLVIGEDFRSSTPVEDLGVISSLKKLTYFETDLRLEDLSFLAGATALEEIILTAWRGGASIGFSTLDPLTDLTNLRVLDLTSAGRLEDCPEGLGDIAEISALANLTKLEDLNLSFNSVSDITPLVENEGLGEGDVVNLFGNPLETEPGSEDRQNIDALVERGVEVEFDTSEDCVDGGDNDQIVEVPDAALERLIREEIDKPEGELTREDLREVSSIFQDGRELDAQDLVRNLEGLQFATNLSVLDLPYNYVQDLSPLAENEGLGSGDDVVLLYNPIETCPDTEGREILDALEARGVDVFFSQASNCGPPEPGLRGGTINVTSTSDEAYFTEGCTLRDAITAANTGVAIGGCPSDSNIEVIELGDEVYTLTEVDNITDGANGLPSIRSGIFLRSEDDAVVRRAEDAPAFRLLHVAQEGDLTVVGGIYEGGDAADAQGGGLYNAGFVEFSGSTIRGGSASEGGGIYNLGGIRAVVLEVSGNEAAEDGGGIYNAGDLSFAGGALSDNRSGGNGGGLYSSITADAEADDASASLLDTVLEDNEAPSGFGGGLYNAAGTLNISESVLQNNTARSGGGAANDATMLLTDANVQGNSSPNDGSGLYNTGRMNLTGGSVSENSTFPGGSSTTPEGRGSGVFNRGASVIQDTDFLGNGGAQAGGAVANEGNMELIRTTVSGNRAAFFGDALFNEPGGTLMVRESQITGNEQTDPRVAGGSVDNAGQMTIISSTVSGNRADDAFEGQVSSGVRNVGGNLRLINATVTNNTQEGSIEARGISSESGERGAVGTLTLVGTLIAEHELNCEGPLTSEGYNLDSDGSCDLDQETDLSNVDPDLEPLEDNGGPTLTRALQEGSPAVDAIPAGACEVDTDQRGVARPQGEACDIGAFEREQ